MSGIASAIGISGVLGAGASIFGSLTQKKSTDKALALQQQMFGQSMAANQPFITAGQGAAGTLADLLKPGGNMSDILKNIPGFKFLQDITQQGVSNQATATGLSGNTLLAGANAGNQVALGAGWQPIVNSLQGLINTGQGAAGTLTGAATATGAGGANSLIQGGNAIAGGAMGAANQLGGSLTSAALLNKVLAQGGGAGAANSMYGPGWFPSTAWYNQ